MKNNIKKETKSSKCKMYDAIHNVKRQFKPLTEVYDIIYGALGELDPYDIKSFANFMVDSAAYIRKDYYHKMAMRTVLESGAFTSKGIYEFIMPEDDICVANWKACAKRYKHKKPVKPLVK